MELALNLFKNLRINQAGNRDRDDFLIGLALSSARRPNIELPLADIDGVCQDMVYRANSKGHATPGAIAITIEPFDDFLDAERARVAVAVQIQVEYKLDDLGFGGVEVQFFLDLRTALFGFNLSSSGSAARRPSARSTLASTS